jgi:DNA-binding transcriptional MerR regulator
MKNNSKSKEAYKTIGEVARDLNLVNEKNGIANTHTIRFWEKEFKQIKPTIKAGGRRYYSNKDFEKIKLIKFLLKEQGFTIKGVKKMLINQNLKQLDDYEFMGVNNANLSSSKSIKSKASKIYNKIKELKKLING